MLRIDWNYQNVFHVSALMKNHQRLLLKPNLQLLLLKTDIVKLCIPSFRIGEKLSEMSSKISKHYL